MFNTLGAFLTWAEQAFIEASLHFGHGTDNAWDEAVAIALFVLCLPPDIDASVVERPLTQEESSRLQSIAEKRLQSHMPLPYLTHTAWFAGLPFYVNEQVLIPRSPMGELIEQRLMPWAKESPMRILDLCCGSGCLAVALAKAFPEALVDAIDIDPAVLRVARMNVVRHRVEEQVHLLSSDLFSEVKGRQYDIIISNPPYVAQKEMETLPKEYLYEPTLALEAGQDGLTIVRRILDQALDFLTEEGILIVEVGSTEAAVIEAFPTLPLLWLEFERGGEGVFLLQKGATLQWKRS